MAIIATLNSLDRLKELEEVVDAISVPTSFSTYTDVRFNNEEVNYIVKQAKKPLYLLVNGLYEDKDMKGVEELIKMYKGSVHYIFGDLGVLEVLINNNLETNGVYYPSTLICSSKDALAYLDFSLEAVGLSSEIPVSDMALINKASGSKTLIKVFGYHPMFISKRNLITTYLEHIEDKSKLRRGYLIEEKRPDKLPIIEDLSGTTIYRHYPLNLIKEIDQISSSNLLYFNSSLIAFDSFIETIKIYKMAIEKEIQVSEAFLLLKNIHPYDDGFMYTDTVYKERDF